MNHLILAAALIAAPVAASATVQETCSDLAMVAAGAITLRDKGVDMTTGLDALSQVEGMTPEALDMHPTVSPELLATTNDVAELVTLLARAKEELRMIRMKDSGAVYDVLLRTELDAALARVKGVM